MNNAGIDYGLGRTNINHATGIRFGVISQNSILQAWADNSEAEYGEASCPECGGDVVEYEAERHAFYKGKGSDYACEGCFKAFWNESVYPEEPIGYTYDGNGYHAETCLDNDIILTLSPFFTYAAFCSPCVPGAGDLNNPMDGGIKTYCFGPELFEGGIAPYPVYRVQDEVNL